MRLTAGHDVVGNYNAPTRTATNRGLGCAALEKMCNARLEKKGKGGPASSCKRQLNVCTKVEEERRTAAGDWTGQGLEEEWEEEWE